MSPVYAPGVVSACMMYPAILELQQHSAALRRLARDLVGKVSADDVLQDVAIEVLREQMPSEIAAATGEPVRTVKTRLLRGLGLLRERFDADGRDWRAAFGVAFGLREASAGAGVSGVAGITTGIFWMSTTTKWAFAAVALLAVGFGLWQLGPSVVAPLSAPEVAKAQEPERTAAPIAVAPVARASAEQIVVHVTDAASGAPIEASVGARSPLEPYFPS
jgi:hypothetical protein